VAKEQIMVYLGLDGVIVMQRLIFESAWDKTIDVKDRQDIITAFEQAKQSGDNQLFIPLCSAINHRRDLLVSVIIQNDTDKILSLQHKTLMYKEGTKPIATQTFHDRRLTIPAKCSMPWTFIFPCSTLKKEPQLEDGHLQVVL
jgi:SLAP domain-containing protein